MPSLSRLPASAAGRADALCVALVPGVATVALALTSGGFSPQWTGVAVVVVLMLILFRCMLAPAPTVGMGRGLVVGGGALAAFAAWTLLSSAWSGSPARATLEADRALLYVVVLLAFASIGVTPRTGRLLLGGLGAAASLVVCLSLVSFLLPETLPIGDSFGRVRLSWPTSYWNATGLLAGLCVLWLTGISSGSSFSVRVRVVAAAVVPVAAATLYATVSRGAAASTVIGVVVLVLVVRDRTALGGVPVALLGAAAGILATARAHSGLKAQTPSLDALASGRHVAVWVLAAVVGCGVLRALATLLERRMGPDPLPWIRRRGLRAGSAAVVLGLVAVALAIGGAERLRDAADRFASPADVPANLSPNRRFADLGNNGRLDHWRVAINHGLRPHLVHGTGAGTYPLLWAAHRRADFIVIDGHSLYAEVAGELGLVGLVLILAFIGAVLAGLARRIRGPNRAVWGTLLATAVTWAVHAGVDWDWEMPAVTLWLMAAGGLALSRNRPADLRPLAVHRFVRLGAGMACIGLAVVPARIALSQARLEAAVTELRAGDCHAAERHALRAADALGIRPEPFEILAYCDVRAGRTGLAQEVIDKALSLDPDNWELHYARSLILAVGGEDPRTEARVAVRLNPRDPLARYAAASFVRGPRRQWRASALRAPLPVRP